MRRIFALALTMTSLLTIACSGSAPTSPSRAAVASPSAAIAVAPSIPQALFGSSAVDFASCLQAASASGCFTATRVRTSAATAGALAPTAPAGLTATAVGSTVTLTWLAPTGNDPVYVYLIEAGSKPGAADLANFSTGTNVTAFSASGVGAGSYYVRVRASDRIVASAASNEVLLVVDGGGACTSPPGAPSGLATSASGSTVTLTWSAPAGGCAPSSYMLQAGSAAGLSNLANSNTGNTSTSYIAQGVGAGTYFVRILAANAFGQSAASNESTLVVGLATPGGTVTGRWVGVAPDGVIFSVPSAPDTTCDDADDLQLDLTQVGTALTGTITLRTRSARTPPNCSGATVAGITTLTNGSASGTGISFQLGTPPRSLTFTGVVSGNRMSGVAICGGDGSQCGTFVVTRQ